MPVFVFSIAAEAHRPSDGDGFVRAETIRQAVALIGHPEVNVYMQFQIAERGRPEHGRGRSRVFRWSGWPRADLALYGVTVRAA